MAGDDILRWLLIDGTPDPLANLSVGTYAVIDDSARITVFAPLSDHAWTLSAQASWPGRRRAVRNVWAAIAPADSGGVVVVNMSAVDISGVPGAVQWCLRLQNARHGLRALRSMRGLSRAVLRDGVLTFTGLERVVRIGPPYTATAEAYREQADAAFEFLSPALQTVARVIAQQGPVSRVALAAELYDNPSDRDRSALEMTLSRLRQHPRVRLERGDDGLLTIALVGETAQPAGQDAVDAVAADVMAS
jgi:hypothetical protein